MCVHVLMHVCALKVPMAGSRRQRQRPAAALAFARRAAHLWPENMRTKVRASVKHLQDPEPENGKTDGLQLSSETSKALLLLMQL